MKNKILVIGTFLILLGSCAPGANSPLEDHLITYNWRITYLKHANVEQTSTFTLYSFDFAQSNVVYAIRPDSTFQGSWERTNSSQSNPKVLLDFAGHYQLYML